MNYVNLINEFWELRRKEKITNIQADLYFFILHESNSRGKGKEWENPFKCGNDTIKAGIGIAISTLQEAREKLVELGLITFKPGIKNITNPEYFIAEFNADNRRRNRQSTGNDPGDTSGNETGDQPEHNTDKQKLQTETETETIIVPAEKTAGPGKTNTRKKTEAEVPYWPAMVEIWFFEHKQVRQEEPTFDAAAGKKLREILKGLRKRTEQADLEWTEDRAKRTFQAFLNLAKQDKFLLENFDLRHLHQNQDKIISLSKKAANGAKANKPATGANVDVADAFAKIDQHLS